ncbi:FG-GAP-like repeat-containing protein [Flavobacterium sp.]|uniref:FG-GAP-like repeat-containing protein n=1 Tax=Flavobacterium sp. TaxID=239 RepID=UPI003342DC9B
MKKITLLFFLFCGIQFSHAQGTCATAQAITAGLHTVTEITGTNTVTPCYSTNATKANWYSYTPTQNYTVTISSDLAINICKDTFINVYSGSCSSLSCLASDDDAGVIACNNGSNTNSYLSVVTFIALAGNTYYFAWDNRWSAASPLGFDFQLTEAPVAIPPISFTPASITSSATICSVADLNGDYLDDIATVQTNQMTVLTQNTTGGGFTSTIYPLPNLTATPSWSITAGDFDKNGYNDLVFGSGNRVAVIKANATGSGYTEFAYPQNIFTQRANFVDINNDGHLDLWACHDVAQSHAYRNDGTGNLNFDISLMPTLAVGGNYQSQWSDLDNDGDIDMYLAKCRGGAAVGDPQRINLFYKNNGNGTFTESGAVAGINDGAQSWSSAIEDYDNDGDMDILLSNISDTNKLYRNNGDGTFTDVYSASGIDSQVGSWELQAADFNNDGWMDFLWQNSKELYLNNGNLTFTGYDLSFSEGGIGDLNNDGFLDVQFNNQVFYNVPNANNWIKIKLQGIQSNRNGIGARIEIYGAFGKQIREIKSGNGFSHQSTLNAHFGIGTETAITQIIIRWPSGIVDTITNPTINNATLVVEGSTLTLEEYTNSEFSLYPIPAKNVLNIKTNNEITLKLAKVFDLNGKQVFESNITSNQIPTESLSKGTYILLLRDSNDKDYSQKFIKE